jgi:hypothetical protein
MQNARNCYKIETTVDEYITTKICTSCGVQLTLENTSKIHRERKNYKCMDCFRTIDAAKRRANYSPKEAKFANARRLKKIKENDPVKFSAQRMVYGAKTRSAKKELAFDLDVEYVISICPVKCPVMNVAILYGGNDRHRYSASLDRIVPELGYIKGNVQVITDIANRMKNDASHEELKLFAKWILEK